MQNESSLFGEHTKNILKFDIFFYLCKYLNSLKNFKPHMTSQNGALLYRIYF